MFIAKSFKVRHSILKFLRDERRKFEKAGGKGSEAQFTIDKIVEGTGFSEDLIDEQLDYLYESKEAIDVNEIEGGEKVLKWVINSTGMKMVASRALINEGKIITSQLFNNYSSGIFQILIGVVAIVTVSINLTSTDKFERQLDKLELRLEDIEEYQIELEGHEIIQNNVSDTNQENQTNSQIDDKPSN